MEGGLYPAPPKHADADAVPPLLRISAEKQIWFVTVSKVLNRNM